jgi:hypothetical protein
MYAEKTCILRVLFGISGYQSVRAPEELKDLVEDEVIP